MACALACAGIDADALIPGRMYSHKLGKASVISNKLVIRGGMSVLVGWDAGAAVLVHAFIFNLWRGTRRLDQPGIATQAVIVRRATASIMHILTEFGHLFWS